MFHKIFKFIAGYSIEKLQILLKFDWINFLVLGYTNTSANKIYKSNNKEAMLNVSCFKRYDINANRYIHQ